MYLCIINKFNLKQFNYMNYLINWIKKELNPENHISSKSTSSEYFYFYGAKIRLSDHMTGHNDNDLEIIRVMDLFGKNKQFLIKEKSSPNMITVPDVKTLKIVLSTFIFQFKNKFDNKQLILNSQAESLKTSFNECVNKIINNEELTLSDLKIVNQYMGSICPQWMSLKEIIRNTALHLFKFKVNIENVKDIIDIEFPYNNQSIWQERTLDENIKCITQYLPDDYKVEDISIREQDPIVNKSSSYERMIIKYNNFKNIGYDNLDDEDKIKYTNTLGSLLVEDTGGKYSKLTQAQRRLIRELLYHDLPYEDIFNFFKNTFTKRNKALVPSTPELTHIVSKFLKMYNIGIIKYPNETDFNTTYNDNFIEKLNEEVKEENIEDVCKSVDNIEETSVQETNDIIDFIPDTDITIKDSYDYANAEFKEIKDIHELFESNQLNILDEVIKKINDTNKYTSFETRRITDIFSKHYSEIWDKLTWSQKELCSSIITEERMNLNETDFIINSIFDKTLFNWPVTEQCRKDIKMYCQRIKESRMAA